MAYTYRLSTIEIVPNEVERKMVPKTLGTIEGSLSTIVNNMTIGGFTGFKGGNIRSWIGREVLVERGNKGAVNLPIETGNQARAIEAQQHELLMVKITRV